MMRSKSKISLVIIIILLVIAIGAVAFLVLYFFDDTQKINETVKNDTSGIAQTQSQIDDVSSNGDNPEQTAPTMEVVENPVDFKAINEINTDVYSWIHIPNTNVDYPVAQSSDADDAFYLSHNVYKEYQFSGTIYSEKKNSKDYSDRVTVLYGHNMLNGSMFATLHNFADTEFFNENKDMYVYTKDRAYTYEIYSAFEYDNRHILNTFDFTMDSVYQEFLDYTMNPRSVYSNVRDGVEVTTDDKILILSTCGNDYRDIRFLVVGVLVNEQIAQ